MKCFSLILILICFCSFGRAQTKSDTIKVRGRYQGKNVYVFHPMHSTHEEGLPATQVWVNGDLYSSDPQSTAFEIDLSMFDLEVSDPVEILLIHHPEHLPKIINPQAFIPRNRFDGDVLLQDSLTLSWKNHSEFVYEMYTIEQFQCDHWQHIGRVAGFQRNWQHTIDSSYLHTGSNRFRVRTHHQELKNETSNEVTLNVNREPTMLKYDQKKKGFLLSRESYYNIYFKGSLVESEVYDGVLKPKGNLRHWKIYVDGRCINMDEIPKQSTAE